VSPAAANPRDAADDASEAQGPERRSPKRFLGIKGRYRNFSTLEHYASCPNTKHHGGAPLVVATSNLSSRVNSGGDSARNEKGQFGLEG